ncbi:MAG TPA: hypothetical protein PLK77_13385 [Pyrinomonadaceae bacterium]|nr:hypothetical protein [Pyrinomonadaceae bacterium]
MDDLLTILLVFAVLIFLIFAVLAISVGMFGMMRRQAGANLQFWQHIGDKLGLSVNENLLTNFPNPRFGRSGDPNTRKLSGRWKGREIVLAGGRKSRVTPFSSRGNYRKFPFTYCIAYFPSQLRLLLDIQSPRSLASDIQPVGLKPFDNNFKASCYDPGTLRSILLSSGPSIGTQSIAQDLLAARNSFSRIEVNDRFVYLERDGRITDDAALRQMLDGAVYFADRFISARAALPLAPWETQLIAIWRIFARENGLEFDVSTFSIRGRYAGFDVDVHLTTEHGKWQTIFKLTFPQDLGLGLQIIPRALSTSVASWFDGIPDLKIGNEGFDREFITSAWRSEAAAKNILNENLCLELQSLGAAVSGLHVNDTEIFASTDTIVTDPRLLYAYLDQIQSVASAFNSSKFINRQ